MTKRLNMNKERVFLFIVLLVSSVLFLANLGNRYLWQDEAETALVSKTILKHGIPLGYDGKNFFSQEGQSSYGKDYLWVLDPWLPHYLVAASFKIVGVNTFAARFPFAMLGIATTILTYFLAWLLTKDKKTAAMATVLVLTSVSFLILCRQSRYYALSAFLSLLGLYGYLMFLESKKGGSVTFILSGILLFHCQHLFCATMLAAVVTHALLCYRRQVVKIFIFSLIVVLVNLPWLLWISQFRLVNIYGFRLFNKEFLLFLRQYLCHIHYYIFPLFLLLIPLCKGLFLWIRHKSIRAIFLDNLFLWRNLLLLFLFILFTTIALSVVSPGAAFRYLTPSIPVFCIIAAVILRSLAVKRFKTVVVIMAALFVSISFVDYRYGKTHPNREGIKYLNFFDYIDEITSDYDCPIEGIVKYLNANGTDDDIVTITYGDLPLKFYTKMKVIGGLTGEDLSLVKEADWIIIRKHILSSIDLNVLHYIMQNASGRYKKIVLRYPEMPWSNRPSPLYHQFRTIKSEDKVIIYQRY